MLVFFVEVTLRIYCVVILTDFCVLNLIWVQITLQFADVLLLSVFSYWPPWRAENINMRAIFKIVNGFDSPGFSYTLENLFLDAYK